mmetsp:Transcript_11570/g.24241  ORF Transcript_11570/g.24241 Transcript_11570/m.24241 type:complete len:298 (+) Transcript_11570:637-1530(+)
MPDHLAGGGVEGVLDLAVDVALRDVLLAVVPLHHVAPPHHLPRLHLHAVVLVGHEIDPGVVELPAVLDALAHVRAPLLALLHRHSVLVLKLLHPPLCLLPLVLQLHLVSFPLLAVGLVHLLQFFAKLVQPLAPLALLELRVGLLPLLDHLQLLLPLLLLLLHHLHHVPVALVLRALGEGLGLLRARELLLEALLPREHPVNGDVHQHLLLVQLLLLKLLPPSIQILLLLCELLLYLQLLGPPVCLSFPRFLLALVVHLLNELLLNSALHLHLCLQRIYLPLCHLLLPFYFVPLFMCQ